jgi:hypothetical protein
MPPDIPRERRISSVVGRSKDRGLYQYAVGGSDCEPDWQQCILWYLIATEAVEEYMASIYRVRNDFDKKIERAGLSKAELARRAEVSKYTLQKKTSGEIPRTRGAIAWRLA